LPLQKALASIFLTNSKVEFVNSCNTFDETLGRERIGDEVEKGSTQKYCYALC